MNLVVFGCDAVQHSDAFFVIRAVSIPDLYGANSGPFGFNNSVIYAFFPSRTTIKHVNRTC